MAVLTLGPDAHKQLDIIERPGAALEMSVRAGQGGGVSPVHADIPLVMVVEKTPDTHNVGWAAGVQSELQTDIRNEIVEALLAVKRGAREREG